MMYLSYNDNVCTIVGIGQLPLRLFKMRQPCHNSNAFHDLFDMRQAILLKLYDTMANDRYDMISNLSDEINKINKQIIKKIESRETA